MCWVVPEFNSNNFELLSHKYSPHKRWVRCPSERGTGRKEYEGSGVLGHPNDNEVVSFDTTRNRRSFLVTQMWRQIALSSQNRPKETSHFLANPSVNCSILDFQSFLFPSSSSFFLSLPASFWSAVLLTTALFLCLEGSSNEAKRSHCHGFLVINIIWKD